MANAVHGRKTNVWVNEFDLSRYLNKYTADRNAPELDQTTFLALAREFLADLPDGSMGLEGFYKGDSVNLDTAEEVFAAALSAANRVATVCPEGGDTFGLRCFLQDAVETKHHSDSPATGLVMSSADFRGPLHH